jgi:hypothetical protein
MRAKLIAFLFAGMLALGVAAPAFGDPAPPAPGNGGGNSEQCTGPQADRPASCTSQGGPGDP